MGEVSRKAKSWFYPCITFHMKVERPFSIDIGRGVQDNRSDRRFFASRHCMNTIIEQEIEPQLPDGFWWGVKRTASSGSGTRETTDWFELEIRLPVTDEAEELVMLWILQGKAQMEPLPKSMFPMV